MPDEHPIRQPGMLAEFGAAWNRFWFAPRDAYPLAMLRIALGLIALYWLVSWTPDLVPFFGPQGLVSVELIDQFSPEGRIPPSRLTYLSLFSSVTELYIVHAIGIAVLLAFTVGLFTRYTSVAALIVVMSYIHRVEFITGRADAVMVILLFYLCLTPCGRCLSLDRRRADAKDRKDNAAGDVIWTATPGLRLIQCHLTLFYGLMLLAQLTASYVSGPPTTLFHPWLEGTGAWWLAARPDSRMIDITGLFFDSLVIVNAVTHLMTLCLVVILAGLWSSRFRKIALGLTVPFWLFVAIISGQGLFAALMCASGLAFVDASTLRRGGGSGTNA